MSIEASMSLVRVVQSFLSSLVFTILHKFAIRFSDVSESLLPSQSHKPLESELSQSHLKFFRVESES